MLSPKFISNFYDKVFKEMRSSLSVMEYLIKEIPNYGVTDDLKRTIGDLFLLTPKEVENYINITFDLFFSEQEEQEPPTFTPHPNPLELSGKDYILQAYLEPQSIDYYLEEDEHLDKIVEGLKFLQTKLDEQVWRPSKEPIDINISSIFNVEYVETFKCALWMIPAIHRYIQHIQNLTVTTEDLDWYSAANSPNLLIGEINKHRTPAGSLAEMVGGGSQP